MAYVSKDFSGVLRFGAGVGRNIWSYDTVDSLATIYAIGYVSDAKDKGVRKGDIVIIRIWTTAVPFADSELKTPDGTANDLVSTNLHFVIGISATTGAADLTSTLALTATNSD